MTDKEVMKLALEALELVNIEFVCNGAHHAKKDRHSLDEDCPVTVRYQQAIIAIKDQLAQPEQEPVAWAHYDTFKNLGFLTRARFTATLATKKTDACCIALYTHPINQKEFK